MDVLFIDAYKKDKIMTYILYNPISGDGTKTRTVAEGFLSKYEDSEIVDIVTLNLSEFFSGLSEGDKAVVFGGDGTLNKIANAVDVECIKAEILYFPAGTGNDFAVDIGMHTTDEPFVINEYLKGLPTVTVNGRDYKFINGVGYGIDGYCCEVGDKMKAEGKKPNYTSIAISGLLFHFKPKTAKVVLYSLRPSLQVYSTFCKGVVFLPMVSWKFS